ncbi:unnamed protein product [Cylindrotheca closterium]|uniref:Helicase-associated domain-containing protein n=1 Tax=Cylindrotheca closterium TaxID=2856 RepID=A0AAD2G193_9STRA|nr:unnamed protein product [Cylindrotheca closterium]
MIFNHRANSDRLRNDSCIYSNLAEGSLMSLLARPLLLPSLDQFDLPFDDPNMEPLPLRPQGQVPQLVHSAFPVCSMIELLSHTKPTRSTNHPQGLIHSSDTAGGTAGVERRSDEAFFTTDQMSLNKKRQRMSPVKESPDGDEVMARFRPYQESKWRTQFKRLVQFKFEHGHCCVPHSSPEDPILARWVKRQRYQFKKLNDGDTTSTMTTHRIQDLESIGFVWHSHNSAWQEKVNELIAFKQIKGHCNVPSHYPRNAALSTWVKCQRRQYKRFINGSLSSNMTMGRLQMLESLGFVFDIQKSKRQSRETN